ncbi:MAG: uroporphyrinogen decarboxylase family protein [Armatimonadota bacterium]|nr:uroporphyrinogen decarboxylase family protein [Armatimonadota bacterium]MDR7534311.1 uroporphyrinogen decarboxylase family protein [Armatimonadota bacterium]MDR7535923.1 uroporphyrinogen decarboxylase family protein [Armatimonadota bacterium]
MTRHERVRAALAGEPVDRVPISFWQHFPGQDQHADTLADATIRYQRRFDLDLVKLMPTGMYSVVDYGVSVVPSGDSIGTTRHAAGPIREPGDWARLPTVSPARGALAVQVEAVRLVRRGLGPDVPILQTIFSPLTMAAKIAGGNAQLTLAGHEAALEPAQARLAEDVIAFGRACLDGGADGFFFATQLANGAAPPGWYERLGVRYDLHVLEALRPRSWALWLHLHGDDPLFELADRYPIDGVNWHARETQPSLAAAMLRTRRGLVGGVARMGPIASGRPEEVVAEVRDAIAQTGGARLIVAPGCVIPTTAPERNLEALRRAVG